MIDGSAKNLVDAVIAVLANSDEHPTLENVNSLMTALRAGIKVTPEEFDAAERHIQARLILSMGKGVVVAQPFESWLRHRKADIEPYYWNRYRQFLLQLGWGPAVVRQMDQTVDEMLDYAGDPTLAAPWKRRGLVVGNVQSGKTATYIALCNKAADAGYRLIILLAGTLNSLRYQTQVRMDEGFIGFDSVEIGGSRITKGSAPIGVGRFDNQRAPHAFTSKAGDFNASVLTVRTRLAGLSAPVLMVVKKNKRILENLYAWLSDQNRTGDEKIQVPLLLIDDEADAASVNTGSDETPKAINAAIRRILTLFSRSSYIGFTATPFANIFIAPDTEHDMFEDDLFPSDYIYSLEPPSDYIGPVTMFGEDDEKFIRVFDDAEAIFPARHKKELVVDKLPESMIEAVCSFLIVNAIRDLRGHGPTHRSMLVNVSWANNVQNQVAALIRDELDAIVRDVQSFAAYAPEHALGRSERIRFVKSVYDSEHVSCGFTWPDVQEALFDAIRAIDVRAVNMGSGTSRLDYEANRAKGLRVIAVGGNALSRGLTLEGLSTSYIYRNSQAYDTLLQMGRWFGYRPGFDDLCRVWMSESALSWYTHITQATEELRAEFRRMHDLKLTPRQFGLKVRAHPESLIVTARAKMRTATSIEEGPVSLSLQHPEGAQLLLSEEVQSSNLDAARRFVGTLIEGFARSRDYGKKRAPYYWREIPKLHIADMLASFQVHPGTFQPQQIARFLRDVEIPELAVWDVAVLPGNSKERIVIAGNEVPLVIRKVSKIGAALEISKRRLGSAEDEAIGLSDSEYDDAQAEREARQKQGEKTPLGYAYRLKRKRPLLLLYFIEPTDADGNPWQTAPTTWPIASIGMSIPAYEDDSLSRKVKYQTNQVWQQMRLDLQAETDEDELLESSVEA